MTTRAYATSIMEDLREAGFDICEDLEIEWQRLQRQRQARHRGVIATSRLRCKRWPRPEQDVSCDDPRLAAAQRVDAATCTRWRCGSICSAGGKRAMAVWHRRAGKDDVCLHHTAVQAWERIGNYWHCLPEYAQARKAIWTAVNPHTGKRRIDEAFPHELRANTNDTEMFIRFKNGSTWQCIGSDRYDATVGSGVSRYRVLASGRWRTRAPGPTTARCWRRTTAGRRSSPRRAVAIMRSRCSSTRSSRRSGSASC